LHATRILVSGDLDEYDITELVEQEAPIDGFGVGTKIGVGAGSVAHGVAGGALGGVFKLVNVESAGQDVPRIKTAGDKTTWPGKKEVYRIGSFEHDVVALEHEPKPANAQRLLRPVVRDGELLPGSLPPLSEIWEYAQQNLRELPDRFHALTEAPCYPVKFSSALKTLQREAIAQFGNGKDAG